MHTKRIIPCLDVNNNRVVKGVNFVNLRDAGDPVEVAKAYNKAGADELVFLDITASSDNRNTVVDMVRRVAEQVFIPFTVGGGIRTVDDFKTLLREGADKISINSSAIMNPRLISDAADKFGSQCVVVAIDAKRRADGSGWNIYKNGGRVDVGIDAVEWARKVDKLGAGEILLTSMDCDGTKAGYDLELTRAISLQMAPQIRLIQSNDIAMSEKIQSTLVNTIPLWKSQMVIAIGLDHATDAAKAQRAVSDMTNELLKKNAEALKVASVETAKESERGIVDIETLKSTNQTLMTTLDEVMKIQEEGRARRQSAEEDLQRIENEMRDKLLEMSRASHT